MPRPRPAPGRGHRGRTAAGRRAGPARPAPRCRCGRRGSPPQADRRWSAGAGLRSQAPAGRSTGARIARSRASMGASSRVGHGRARDRRGARERQRRSGAGRDPSGSGPAGAAGVCRRRPHPVSQVHLIGGGDAPTPRSPYRSSHDHACGQGFGAGPVPRSRWRRRRPARGRARRPSPRPAPHRSAVQPTVACRAVPRASPPGSTSGPLARCGPRAGRHPRWRPRMDAHRGPGRARPAIRRPSLGSPIATRHGRPPSEVPCIARSPPTPRLASVTPASMRTSRARCDCPALDVSTRVVLSRGIDRTEATAGAHLQVGTGARRPRPTGGRAPPAARTPSRQRHRSLPGR